MGLLLLSRHAQAAGDDSADPGLSTVGRRQAAALGQRLVPARVEFVLHGPSRRAAETAAVLAAAISAPIEVSADLVDLTPVPSPGRRSDYPADRLPWFDGVPPEERDDDGARLTEAWARLQVRAAGTTVALVTHAFVVSRFVATTLDAPQEAWTRLPAANAGLTTIRTGGRDGPVLEGFNDVGHLTGLEWRLSGARAGPTTGALRRR